MDVKVYKKEEVKQPSGSEYIYVPDVIDIIPEIIEAESTSDIRNGTWSLENLKKIADVTIVGNKLIINSDSVSYENGNLIAHLTEEQIINALTLDDGSEELLEQECALATIWQRGLDPLDLEDGIRWSETLLGEINSLQLIQDITEAVANVTNTVSVVFDVVEDSKGNNLLTYTLKEVS